MTPKELTERYAATIRNEAMSAALRALSTCDDKVVAYHLVGYMMTAELPPYLDGLLNHVVARLLRASNGTMPLDEFERCIQPLVCSSKDSAKGGN